MRAEVERCCKICGKVFLTRRRDKEYCSMACKQRAYNGRKNESYAKKTGRVPARVGMGGYKVIPKTYAEIKRENRRRGAEAGWRGQPVIGGGPAQKVAAPLLKSELPRMNF